MIISRIRKKKAASRAVSMKNLTTVKTQSFQLSFNAPDWATVHEETLDRWRKDHGIYNIFLLLLIAIIMLLTFIGFNILYFIKIFCNCNRKMLCSNLGLFIFKIHIAPFIIVICFDKNATTTLPILLQMNQ